jgi:quercetin dioxygenase-like cupin family protein
VRTESDGLLGPAAGEPIELPGARILTKVTAEQTQGRYALVEAHNVPGWESELNRHPHESKVFYVLAGSYEFLIDDRWGDVRPGDTLLIRAGAVHGFRAGPDGGRVLVIYPGRSANWFADAATTGGSGHHGTPQHAALHDRNHVESLGPLPPRPDHRCPTM